MRSGSEDTHRPRREDRCTRGMGLSHQVLVFHFLQKTHDLFFVFRRRMTESGRMLRPIHDPQLFWSARWSIICTKIIEVIDNDDPQNMGRKFFTDIFVGKAIDQAEGILKKIDGRWPREI